MRSPSAGVAAVWSRSVTSFEQEDPGGDVVASSVHLPLYPDVGEVKSALSVRLASPAKVPVVREILGIS